MTEDIYWLVFTWRELRSSKLNFVSPFINSIFLKFLKFRISTSKYLNQSSNQIFSSQWLVACDARQTKRTYKPFNVSEVILIVLFRWFSEFCVTCRKHPLSYKFSCLHNYFLVFWDLQRKWGSESSSLWLRAWNCGNSTTLARAPCSLHAAKGKTRSGKIDRIHTFSS